MNELERLQKEIGVAYSVMPVEQLYKINSDLTDLQKQNDELRAGIAVLASLPIKIRMECRKQIKLNPDQFAESLMNYVQSAISGANAEQSLADIKAEAVIEAGEFIRDRFKPSNEDEHLSHIEIDQMLVNYANRIKED